MITDNYSIWEVTLGEETSVWVVNLNNETEVEIDVNDVSLFEFAFIGSNQNGTLLENNFFVGDSNNRVSKKTLIEAKQILGVGEGVIAGVQVNGVDLIPDVENKVNVIIPESSTVLADNITITGVGSLIDPLKIATDIQRDTKFLLSTNLIC